MLSASQGSAIISKSLHLQRKRRNDVYNFHKIQIFLMFGYGTGGHDKGDFPPVFLKRKTPSKKLHKARGWRLHQSPHFQRYFFLFIIIKTPEGRRQHQSPSFSRTFTHSISYLFLRNGGDNTPPPNFKKNEYAT